ncbi:uncharacterized protein CLBA1 [Hippopotamus amphibius kiboko]|uniref:uncharacterized protein CLBA1 n=1 Tax=Hippopotamus amphibius kiboko TaxID=575201 RepID=UPI0025933CD2|nr:uncharacterized protein CLBA1 [Hippopotamus amphibius kiboko]
MQDQREPGPAPGQMPPLCAFLSDLAGQAGGVSLCRISKDSCAGSAPGGQSGDAVEWARPGSPLPPPDGDGEARISGRSGEGEGPSACTAGGPDPGEQSGAWGEFEAFRESSAGCEQFSQSFKLSERPTEPQLPGTTSAQMERGSCQPHQGGPGVTGTGAVAPSEPIVSYENIFRFAFQEVPVLQATEDVSALDHFLETSNEEKPDLESVHRLCSESRKLWRALQNTGTTTTSRCLWSESHCRENFLPVLGIDAAQKVNELGGSGLLGAGWTPPHPCQPPCAPHAGRGAGAPRQPGGRFLRVRRARQGALVWLRQLLDGGQAQPCPGCLAEEAPWQRAPR